MIFEASRVITYVSLLLGHPWVAHVRCRWVEGLVDLKSREIILPMAYRKIQVEEGDFAYMIVGDWNSYLYDIAERNG